MCFVFFCVFFGVFCVFLMFFGVFWRFLAFLILVLDSSCFSSSVALIFVENYCFWSILGPFLFFKRIVFETNCFRAVCTWGGAALCAAEPPPSGGRFFFVPVCFVFFVAFCPKQEPSKHEEGPG